MHLLDALSAVGRVLLVTSVLVSAQAVLLVSVERWLIGSGPRAAAKGPGDGRASGRPTRGFRARGSRCLVIAGVVLFQAMVVGSALDAASTTRTPGRITLVITAVVLTAVPTTHAALTWRALINADRWWDRTVPVTATPHDRRARRHLMEATIPHLNHGVFVCGAVLPGVAQCFVSYLPSITATVPDTDPVLEIMVLLIAVISVSGVAWKVVHVLNPLAPFTGLVLRDCGKPWSDWQGARLRPLDLRSSAAALWRWERRELRRVPPSLRDGHAEAFHQACEALRLLDDRRHTDAGAAVTARTLCGQVVIATLATDHRLATRVAARAVPSRLRTTPPHPPVRSRWAGAVDVVLTRAVTVLTFVSCLITVLALVLALVGGAGFADAWKDFRL
ncbi:hypothetical protein [Kineococcus radiotolerans]|uniref:Uncharacterized protein n=1 Tax=Kineococcus radiotolerans (strain ATCC BAA-149 / DSM 14245 / SRS30216) TaxID=266940 RepID=A6W4W2_KINRD|nr:hypothetical protein [Kineococcus radiotolerans]ABS01851.1 hypothetical protein Krad_0361 [Kineococcus radiotolerans SRS30216 = ATCC BAA-149]